MLNLANILTMSRIVLLIPITALFYLEGEWGLAATLWIFALYIISAVTDFFDGWVARKFNQITPFGTFLDPISDKIVVGAMLVLLIAFGRIEGLWIIPVLLIFFREFLISGLREYLGPHNVQMPVTELAKWKTTTQMLCIPFLIIGDLIPGSLMAGQSLLTFAAILTLITGWIYLKTGLEFMSKQK